MSNQKRHRSEASDSCSQSDDDSTSNSSSNSSSDSEGQVPKAYARFENDSQQVQTLVDREKEKIYRKRPYSVSLSSGAESDSSKEQKIPKAYLKTKGQKDGNTGGSSENRRIRTRRSGTSSSDSSSSSSSSDSEPAASQTKRLQKKLSPSRPKESSAREKSNHRRSSGQRDQEDVDRHSHRNGNHTKEVRSRGPRESRGKGRQDKEHEHRRLDQAEKSHQRETSRSESRSRRREVAEEWVVKHSSHNVTRSEQEHRIDKHSHPVSRQRHDDEEKYYSRDERHDGRLREPPRKEDAYERSGSRRTEDSYQGRVLSEPSRHQLKEEELSHSRSKLRSSRERDPRRDRDGQEASRHVSEQRSSRDTEKHSRSRSKTESSSKERERKKDREKQESAYSGPTQEYFSNERGCWERRPVADLEKTTRKASPERHTHRESRKEKSSSRRPERVDDRVEDAERRKQGSHDVERNDTQKKHYPSKETPTKVKSVDSDKKKKKKKRAEKEAKEEKEKAKIKKKRRKEKAEKKKVKKKDKERREKRGKERKDDRRERRGESPIGPRLSSIQAKLLDIASGGDTPPPPPRSLAPMTKHEYDRHQSRTLRVYDSDTGRHRLVRGDGEIVEEIVSRDRHRHINKQSTRGDGLSFQRSLGLHRY